MKKALLSIVFLCTIAFAARAQSVSVTAYQKNRSTNADSLKYLNAKWIVDAYVATNGKIYVTYDEFKTGLPCEYTIRESLDTLQARANKFGFSLIKLHKAAIVSSVDTFVTYLYNIDNIKGYYNRTTSGLGYATSKLLYKQFTNVLLLPIHEPKAQIKTTIDSTLANASKNISATKYDTATYTLKVYETVVVLKSLTDDTLVLLNPALYYNKSSLTIINKSTGTYTLTGGFTVQDKAGSTLSLIAANSSYMLVPYYTGSAYIWQSIKME